MAPNTGIMYHSVITEGNEEYGEKCRFDVLSREEMEQTRTCEFDRSLSRLLNVQLEAQNTEAQPRRRTYNPFRYDNEDMIILDETGCTENDARSDAEICPGELETVTHSYCVPRACYTEPRAMRNFAGGLDTVPAHSHCAPSTSSTCLQAERNFSGGLETVTQAAQYDADSSASSDSEMTALKYTATDNVSATTMFHCILDKMDEQNRQLTHLQCSLIQNQNDFKEEVMEQIVGIKSHTKQLEKRLGCCENTADRHDL